ncbi:MAG: diaminopimelate epimerase [Gemmatimonadaceae bacterium]
MSGSGNDFVMVDCRSEAPGALAQADTVGRICARATGVGADGIVFLEPSDVAAVRLVYLNSDGSRAELCGNATLCTARLAVELGAADPAGFTIETDSGVVEARQFGGAFEIDLQPVRDAQPDLPAIPVERGEQRLGYATVGVPHVVIRADDVATIDVVGRGRPIRRHRSLPRGANANFVSPKSDGRWRIRTYERGVEAETLACGSGSVATAILLTEWGEISGGGAVELETASGLTLRVRLERSGDAWLPSLSGEARVVFQGTLLET